ncbi:phosphoribosylamine--glycine ligase, partial [Candidatus Woesearchaeota archaeon CG_4_10_14_0_2_um_filter_57_5]
MRPNVEKFLFVSLEGLSVDLAWTIAKEGHDVKYYVKVPAEREIGDGFVEKVEDWEEHIDWADVILFDDVLGQGTLAQELRAKGKAVIGGSAYTDMLEDDRTFGQEEMKKAGINILPYQEFTSFDDAIAFVKQNPNKYVIKPSGEAQNIKRLLFIGQEDDGADVVRVLEAYKKTWAYHIKVFQLQKRVTGVEVAVGAFFNGKEFITPINVNFEHKKLFPGNLGPATGEMGTSMFWSAPNKIFNNTLKKMEAKLVAEGYAGYIDINTIVNANGIYPLEWTSRFGYPTISIQQEGMRVPMGQFFAALARGEKPELKVKTGYQVGVRIVTSPYPFKDQETFDTYSKDAAVIFKKPTDGVHIVDVKRT